MDSNQTPPSSPELAEILQSTPRTPEEANAQMTALLRSLISVTGRHEQQIRYLSGHINSANQILSNDMQYLQACLAQLFEHLHLDMPQRRPILIDAKVELLLDDEKEPDEILEMRAAYRSTPHPIHGHYEVILGDKTIDLNDLHVKVVERLTEAFETLRESDKLKPDVFYFVRLHTIHPVPMSEDSMPVNLSESQDSSSTSEAPTDVATS